MFLKRWLCLFVISMSSVLTGTGQSPVTALRETKTDEAKKDEAQIKLNAQAYELFDSVIKDIQRLRLAQNRAYLSVAAAELLWGKDEQGARALFKSAMADLRAILSEPASTDARRSNRERMERTQLREKVLIALAWHDARMALDFLAETRPAVQQDSTYEANYESEFESRLAMIIAANDPAQALEMAQKILAKGITRSLPTLVADIQKKDREAGAQLAGEILAKLKSLSLAKDQEAASVAVGIFQMATEPQDPTVKTAAKDETPLLSEQSLRELAELIAIAAIDASPENAGRSLNVRSLMPQLEKYAPSRMQQLRKLVAQPGQASDDEQPWQEFQRLSESGTVEALAAAAERNPEMSEAYYMQAASRLVKEDKSDRARQLITEHIKDAGRRQQILAELDKQVLTTAASQGKIDETRKLLSRASTNEERIVLLTQLAAVVAAKGDKKTALQLLEEARGMSPGRVRYSRELVAQMQIARAYAYVDPEQSLTIIETSIDQLNELIAAGILLGEFLGEDEVVRDDELLVVIIVQLAESFQQQFGKDLSLLSTANFARTRDAADRLLRFEVRIMARLLVIQSVLSMKVDKKDDLLKLKEDVKPVPLSP